jgi:hypothetical protein
MIRIEGQWNLKHWRRVGSDGSEAFPFGRDATGMLVYTSSGGMIVMMAAANRAKIDTHDAIGGPVEDRAAAYSGYLAYFGRYEVVGNEVHHIIDGSSFPNWSGDVQARPFETDGTNLVLRTPPTEIGGITVVNEMAWTRPQV